MSTDPAAAQVHIHLAFYGELDLPSGKWSQPGQNMHVQVHHRRKYFFDIEQETFENNTQPQSQ